MSTGSPDPGSRSEPGGGDEEQLWAAVADPSRRSVLNLIVAHGEATPTMLAAELPFTRQAVAKHLAVLDRAGLVEGHRSGREVRYRVRPGRLDQAARAMADVAAQLDRQLQAIKRISEAAARATAEENPGSAGPP